MYKSTFGYLVLSMLMVGVVAQGTEQPSGIPATEEGMDTTMTTVVAPASDGCVFPSDLVGDWVSTLFKDPVTFTSTSFLPGFDIGEGISQFQCFKSNDQGVYILRSNVTFPRHELDWYMGTCFSFTKLNPDLYRVAIKTARYTSEDNQPVRIRVAGNEGNEYTYYCNSDNEDIEGYMIKQGKLAEAALGCPEMLDGVFSVTYIDQQHKEKCPDGAQMTSCDVSKSLVFNYTTCDASSSGQYSGNDEYLCLAGRNGQTLLYRNSTEDNSYTPFSCLAISPSQEPNTTNSSELIVVIQDGQGCGGTWLSTQGPVKEVQTLVEKLDDCPVEITTVLDTTTISVDNTSDIFIDDLTNNNNDTNTTTTNNGTDTGPKATTTTTFEDVTDNSTLGDMNITESTNDNGTDTGLKATTATTFEDVTNNNTLGDMNITESTNDNGTDTGPKDAAPMLISSGFFLSFTLACLAILLSDNAIFFL